jgi:hypothetical protein
VNPTDAVGGSVQFNLQLRRALKVNPTDAVGGLFISVRPDALTVRIVPGVNNPPTTLVIFGVIIRSPVGRGLKAPPTASVGFTFCAKPIAFRTDLYGFLALAKREAAHGVFADAAEVQRAVVLDDVRDLGVAVTGAVLEVLDDSALRVESEDE